MNVKSIEAKPTLESNKFLRTSQKIILKNSRQQAKDIENEQDSFELN